MTGSAHQNDTLPRPERLHCGKFDVTNVPVLSPEFYTRQDAQAWLNEYLETLPPRLRPRQRPCLCCKKPFTSAGPQNRLCQTCRTGVYDG